MEKWTCKKDCSVERNLDKYPGMAVLMDCNGDILLIVPDTWKDCQLFTALEFANRAFRNGERMGRNDMIMRFKQLMEIP